MVGLLLGVLVLARVWTSPTSHIAGAEFLDAMGTQWFFAYPGWVLSGATGLAETTLLFHPWGKPVFLHTGGNLLDAVLAAPLRAVFGEVLGYNLWLVVLCGFNGWAAGRFAASWGVGRVGQVIAAALFVLAPFHLYELEWGRPTQALTGFIPLALASLRERRGVAAGVCLALAGWTYWYAGVAAGIAAAVLFPIELAEPGRRQTVRAWLVAAAVAVVLVLPAAIPMLAALDAGQVPGLLALEDGVPVARTVSGDEQGLFVLTALGELGVERASEFSAGVSLFGPVQLLALVAGVFVLRSRSRGPLAVLAVGLLLATGPVLHVGEAEVRNGLYALLVEHVGLFRRWWWPVRASVLVALGVAVFAGAALERLGRWAPLASVPVAVAWCWGFAPLSTWSAQHGPSLACLESAPEGAVIDLPLSLDQRHLWDQVGHGKPQLGGMLSKKAEFGAGRVDEFLAGNAFANDLVQLGAGDFRRGGDEPPGRQDLIELGYRYVVVRAGAYDRPSALGRTSDYARLERALVNRLGPAALRDEEHDNATTVWTLDGSELSCP
ncbi:MAG: hypothetical protein GY884_26555 [Proteobacteria bacterium]|nr:hypothetical protein [Pseudomonadota bacterium]